MNAAAAEAITGTADATAISTTISSMCRDTNGMPSGHGCVGEAALLIRIASQHRGAPCTA
jgi:hypothetical protein